MISGNDIYEFAGDDGKNNARAEVEDYDKNTIEEILSNLTNAAK
jgi:hypothetical protein